MDAAFWSRGGDDARAGCPRASRLPCPPDRLGGDVQDPLPWRAGWDDQAARHGRGNADKEAVIAEVRALGFDPVDDNEADALALLDWALKHGGGR